MCFRLFLLRNVLGKISFQGEWGEDSAIWDTIHPSLQPAEGKGCDAEGLFWITDDELKK